MIPRLNFFSVRKQVIWKERKWAENPGNSIIRVARDRPVAAEAFSKTAAVRPFLLGGTDHEKPPPLKGPTKKVFVYYIDFHSLNRKKNSESLKEMTQVQKNVLGNLPWYYICWIIMNLYVRRFFNLNWIYLISMERQLMNTTWIWKWHY